MANFSKYELYYFNWVSVYLMFIVFSVIIIYLHAAYITILFFKKMLLFYILC